MTVVHPIEEALSEFELIGGAGNEADKKACAMTLLAWVCGEAWTDHPPCANKVIANNVIYANDHSATTSEMRRELVIAGEKGVLDTWWVPDDVVAFSLAVRDGESSDVYERTLRMLARVTEWKGNKERPVLTDADLTDAVLTDAVLTRAVLTGADLTRAVGAPWGGMPAGWKLSGSGLWVKDETA